MRRVSTPRDTVLWDVDGTLLDPADSIRSSIDAATAAMGVAPFHPDDVLIGMPLGQILAQRTGDRELIRRGVEAFQAHYLDRAWRQAAFYPGIRELVGRLHAAGYQQGIVTTKGQAEVEHLVEAADLHDCFGALIGDDGSRALKPDPAPVQAALGGLGRASTQACFVGDTSFDIDAGRAAGVYTLGALWGHGDGQYTTDGADEQVTDAAALEEAIWAWHTS